MRTGMQKNPNIQLLLDTHVFIWLMNGDDTLSAESQKHIEGLVETECGIAVSSISLWEISMLHSRKRIILNQPCLSWINLSLNAPGIHFADLTPEIAVDSCTLPGDFHGDPADRIIVSTARVLGIPLMTRDQCILSYSKKGFIRCIEA